MFPPPSIPTKSKPIGTLYGIHQFWEIFKNSFSFFLIVFPESDISWKEDFRFIGPWEVQQKVHPIARESCAETPRAPQLGAINSLVPLSPLNVEIHSYCSIEQAAVVTVQ